MCLLLFLSNIVKDWWIMIKHLEFLNWFTENRCLNMILKIRQSASLVIFYLTRLPHNTFVFSEGSDRVCSRCVSYTQLSCTSYCGRRMLPKMLKFWDHTDAEGQAVFSLRLHPRLTCSLFLATSPPPACIVVLWSTFIL